MASGDVFKVILEMSLDDVQCRPGFYLVEGSGGGGTDPVLDCANAVSAALGANPIAGFVQNCNLDNIRVEDVGPSAAAAQYSDTWATDTGTVADDNPPPPQDSMLIRLTTAKKSIKGVYATHGRMFIPGIYSTGQVSGFLTPTLYTALGVFAGLLQVPFVDDGTAYQMHIVSFNPGTKPRTIRRIEPVTRVIAMNQVAIQRPRRPGRGI